MEILQSDSRVAIRPFCMVGCTSAIGEMTHVTMRLINRLSTAMVVNATVECPRILKLANAEGASRESGVQLVPILRTPPNDLSFMSMGVMQGMSLHVPAGGSTEHSFGLCFLVPGLYEICAHLRPSFSEPGYQKTG
jgi:hypothetical protein